MTNAGAWIIHSGALGDFTLTLGVIQALRRDGHAPIRVLGRSWYSALAGTDDGVDHVASIDMAPWLRLFGDEPASAVDRLLAGGAPRLVLDLLGVSDAAIAALRDADVQCAIRIDTRPLPGDSRHITRQWADAMEQHGLGVSIAPPRLSSETEPNTARDAVIHVGSGGRHKCWPPASWVQVAKQLQCDGLDVTFLLGPTEIEHTPEATWRATLSPHGEIVVCPPLDVLKRRIRRAALFLGADSGVTHVAAALGVPTIAVFGATDPRVWRPLGPHVTALGGLGKWPDADEVLNAIRSLPA
ncbi:MAG TPA: glycosyltransferase family 9 protein [Phycisphaerae bacterium]|nr:glycosyltransferase family 9 protein [Phycisphaerae bacterium]HRW52385.1 glycosyltransferase family 9 protein [Phycisphaerae bacterium]